MRVVIIEKGIARLNKIIEWLIYMICYTIVFVGVSYLFKSMYIDSSHYYMYSFLIVLVLYILNTTIKPILVKFTIPITGITLGLFYPFINLFILKLADWILGKHFELNNIWIALFISILLSIINFIVENLIIKPLIEKLKKGSDNNE